MARPVLLNNIDHKDLHILTGRGPQFGDNIMLAPTFPGEFRTLQAHYPIVFSKAADGVTFDPVALLGFQEGENLFLSETGWDPTDNPISVYRMPFMIGVVERVQWVACMDQAMGETGVPEDLRVRLKDSFFKTADWMRNTPM